MGSVTLEDGQQVGFVDHGGAGPAVVLLHSFLMDTDSSHRRSRRSARTTG